MTLLLRCVSAGIGLEDGLVADWQKGGMDE